MSTVGEMVMAQEPAGQSLGAAALVSLDREVVRWCYLENDPGFIDGQSNAAEHPTQRAIQVDETEVEARGSPDHYPHDRCRST